MMATPDVTRSCGRRAWTATPWRVHHLMVAKKSTARFADQEPDFPGQCAAANRAGNRCGRHAEPGRVVCSLHGGKSLQGIAHPAYRHGERVQTIGRYTLAEVQQR